MIIIITRGLGWGGPVSESFIRVRLGGLQMTMAFADLPTCAIIIIMVIMMMIKMMIMIMKVIMMATIICPVKVVDNNGICCMTCPVPTSVIIMIMVMMVTMKPTMMTTNSSF